MRNRSPGRAKDSKEDTEIYVGNINAQTPVEPDDLKRLFEVAGTVNNVRIEKSNSKDTHFAFITFGSIEEAEQGCLYDGFKYHALSLKVQRKGRPGPPKLASPPSDDFTCRLKELQEQENTDLYLTNLNTADASEEVLHDTFSAFGDVRRVHLHGDPSNPSRPAFITFSRPEQVQRAVDAMDGKEFLGNTLGVCKARVGQRFWAIEAASKKSAEIDKDKDDKKDKGIDKNGKRGVTSASSSASKDDKDKDRKRRGRDPKDKEDGRKEKEPVKEEKPAAGRTPPSKSISTPTTKPVQGTSSAPSSAGSTSLKPTAKPTVSQPPTTIKTGKPAAAPVSAPPQLSAPPQDPADPSLVLESILAGLERTRTVDKEKNIGLYCSTDPHGVPTMVLPAAGERVCNALITVAQSLRRELLKLKEQHEAAATTLKSDLEQAQLRFAEAGRESAEMKEAFYANQEAVQEVTRLRGQRDQFASLRLVNVKPDSAAKDIAQLCSQFGPVQHVAMMTSVAHVTFSSPVDYQEVAALLTSQIGGHQAEACYHSATVAADVAKQSQPTHLPNSAGNGPVAEHLNPQQPQQPQQQGPIDPMMAPAFPSLPLAGSGLNPNASSYIKGGAHYNQVSQHPKSPQPLQQQQPPPHGKQQPPPQPHQAKQRPAPQEGVCIVCSKIGLQVCSVCMKTYYCGSECQARDWPDHMGECEQLSAKRR